LRDTLPLAWTYKDEGMGMWGCKDSHEDACMCMIDPSIILDLRIMMLQTLESYHSLDETH
jgi:hypothetical protein